MHDPRSERRAELQEYHVSKYCTLLQKDKQEFSSIHGSFRMSGTSRRSYVRLEVLQVGLDESVTFTL